MAYIKIFSNSGGRQIGEMRIIDGRNIIFDMKGIEVGYCVVTDCGDKLYDTDGNIVETVEDLLLHK